MLSSSAYLPGSSQLMARPPGPPATPDQILYAEKAQIFLIATGLLQVIIGTIVLMVVAANCEYQDISLVNTGWMTFSGVVGIMTGICVAHKIGVPECWNGGPITFQLVLLIGFLLSFLVAIVPDASNHSCTLDLSKRHICRVKVCPSRTSCPLDTDRIFICHDCVTAECKCCHSETAAFLTVVYGVITVINAAHVVKYLYFKIWKRWVEKTIRVRLRSGLRRQTSNPVSLPPNQPFISRTTSGQPLVTSATGNHHAEVTAPETSCPLEAVTREMNLERSEVMVSASSVGESDGHLPLLHENPRNLDLPPSYESPPSYEDTVIF